MKKKLFKEMPIITAGAFGILCCGAASVLLLLLCAVAINRGYIDINAGGYVALPVLGLSALSGCFFTGKCAVERRAIACAITAAGYLLLLFVTALLFMDGIHGQVLWGAVAIICGCICGIALTTVKVKKKKRNVKSRFR